VVSLFLLVWPLPLHGTRTNGEQIRMDLSEMIRGLYEEKEKLERVIADLEDLQRSVHGSQWSRPAQRRGRKSMSPNERLEVSQRMKRYWAKRRRSIQS